MATHPFIGDRDAPTLHSSVRTRRAMQGTGSRPNELERMAAVRTIYSQTDTRARPKIAVDSVEHAGANLWKVDVPVAALGGARPGRTLERHPASRFLKEMGDPVSFDSYRPDWLDALPTPELARPETRRFMRRIGGRLTEPLWVYDSHRRAFVDDSWPWGLVGRIFNNNGFSGTGSLVGDRLVITAGHMVPWGSGAWWMKFVPAFVNGTSLFGAGVESYVSDARGYDVHGNVTGYDWAILRLYEPLGSSLGYFGYNGYSSGWNNLPVWSNIGYPGDIDNAEEPAFQNGFTINDTDGDGNGGEELETENCDLNHGNSGGPIFAWWNNGTDPRIVGVVSGQQTEAKLDDNVFASGGGFTSLCAWGRANWPA
jgi:hypothetical protein